MSSVPLSDLAPPPSSEELFGNIEELKEAHKTQLADFEKAQTVNKTRMEQGLEEKLRARKSKRRRQQLHEDQTTALAKKYEKALGNYILIPPDKFNFTTSLCTFAILSRGVPLGREVYSDTP